MAELLPPSEASSLGLHAMLLLARHGTRRLRAGEIAKMLQSSAAHLAKVMLRLEQVGLVTATRGPQGGYRLARRANEITLREVYEAIAGQLDPGHCPFSLPVCQNSGCPLGSFLRRLNRQLVDKLSNTLLSDVPIKTGRKRNENKAKDNKNRRR